MIGRKATTYDRFWQRSWVLQMAGTAAKTMGNHRRILGESAEVDCCIQKSVTDTGTLWITWLYRCIYIYILYVFFWHTANRSGDRCGSTQIEFRSHAMLLTSFLPHNQPQLTYPCWYYGGADNIVWSLGAEDWGPPLKSEGENLRSFQPTLYKALAGTPSASQYGNVLQHPLQWSVSSEDPHSAHCCGDESAAMGCVKSKVQSSFCCQRPGVLERIQKDQSLACWEASWWWAISICSLLVGRLVLLGVQARQNPPKSTAWSCPECWIPKAHAHHVAVGALWSRQNSCPTALPECGLHVVQRASETYIYMYIYMYMYMYTYMYMYFIYIQALYHQRHLVGQQAPSWLPFCWASPRSDGIVVRTSWTRASWWLGLRRRNHTMLMFSVFKDTLW